MPHQCVHCSKIIETGSREILEGCSKCGGRFFFYVRDDQVPKVQQISEIHTKVRPDELQDSVSDESDLDIAIPGFHRVDKKRVEKDVREILDIQDEEKPVILDLESVRVLSPGKFEIDIVSLLNRRPIVFKVEEGKYIIDLDSTLPDKK